MRTLRAVLAVAISLILTAGLVTPANADDTTDMTQEEINSLRMQLPVTLFDDIQNGKLQAGVAFVGGQDGLPTQVSLLRTLAPDGQGSTKLCADYLDTACLNGNVTEGLINLPTCSVDSNSACLEGIKVGSGSAKTSGTFVRNVSNAINQDIKDELIAEFDSYGAKLNSWQANQTWPGVKARDLPRASSPSIWQVRDQTNAGGTENYLARATLKLEIWRDGSVKFTGLSTEIVPFIEISNSDIPGADFHPPVWMNRGWVGQPSRYEWFPRSGTRPLASYDNPGAFNRITCAWEETDKCGLAVKFADGSSAEMTVRIPRELGGWFYGRLNSGDLKLSPINTELNKVTISGKPATIPMSSAQFEIFKTGNESYLNFLTGGNQDYLQELIDREAGPDEENGQGLASWGQWDPKNGISEFTAYENLMGDTAKGEVEMWSADTMPYWETDNPCFADKTRVQGLLTTNAMVYQAGLPQFKSGQLTYQIAGLHNDFNDEEFKGEYTLKMRADDARCLYGYSEGAIQPAVSVTDFSGVKASASTTVTESGGWLTIRATNFTFSKKKVVLTIKQNGKTKVSPVKNIVIKKKKTLSAKYLAGKAGIKKKTGDKRLISVVGKDTLGVKDLGSSLQFNSGGVYYVKVTVKRKNGKATSRLFKISVL